MSIENHKSQSDITKYCCLKKKKEKINTRNYRKIMNKMESIFILFYQ